MKLFSFNTHSLVEGNGDLQCRELARFIESELPNIIALQEVNQLMDSPPARLANENLPAFIPEGAPSVPFKEGNFALSLLSILNKKGMRYHLCWLPIKRGYGRFDEGIAILSLYPMSSARGFRISRTDDYENFRRRMGLLVNFDSIDLSVCALHTSRWDDSEEPFLLQWAEITKQLPRGGDIFLMGDFNCPANEKGGGYERVRADGFFDLYRIAKSRRGSSTVSGGIDGWKDDTEEKRIDFIFSSSRLTRRRIEYKTVLCGTDSPVISDHFGILVKIKEEQA